MKYDKTKFFNTVEKESIVYETLSKAICEMKEIAKAHYDNGINCDDIGQAIKEVSEIRLSFSVAHSMCN